MGRIEGDAEDSPAVMNALGDALAHQAQVGVFFSGKTLLATLQRDGYLQLNFSGGHQLNISGSFTVNITLPDDRQRVWYGGDSPEMVRAGDQLMMGDVIDGEAEEEEEEGISG